ncbi:hypothetical protein I5G78_gp016 [Mycobacterium phage Unicorn]|uniref:Uncharacterized protein n=1 Tax=Mycobacterium phage Unicorn TaxID=2015825 RepID=A0A222ZKW4_9CAUD|nr:hypothetical protein I5G78_gp016 [Mycobacterium phage Unicorn]ASR85098.1 hypothetical protein SEA_UNICORN_90 [Mycobacterium phage Unicorn]
MQVTSIPPVGSRVKLTSDGRRWWDVRAADERFAILTRQAEFRPKGEVCYTILDVEQGVRGPCNLIGQSWHATMPDEECARLLEALNADPRSDGVEVSHRNRVPLDLGEVRPALKTKGTQCES